MKIFRNRCERFERKAHGTQRKRDINWIGDERVPRNAVIKLRSRFSEIL